MKRLYKAADTSSFARKRKRENGLSFGLCSLPIYLTAITLLFLADRT